MPPKKRVAYSEEEFYYKLDNILLSSCQNLRGIFKGKWKRLTGEAWISDKEHGAKLLNSLNKKTKRLVQRGVDGRKIYLEKLTSGIVEHWDYFVLAMVLLNLEGDTPKGGGSEEYNVENEAVQNLRDLGYFMRSTKKLSKEEYNCKLAVFKEAMKNLKVDEMEIKRIVEGAGVSSSNVALANVEGLYKKAAKLIIEKKYEAAIKCYTEAIETPSLQTIQLASVFEMRAEAYLKIANGKKQLILEALRDLEIATKLNWSSWNAHYIAGQCFKMAGDYLKAIERFEEALANCRGPCQKIIKNELDGCKALLNYCDKRTKKENDETINFKGILTKWEKKRSESPSNNKMKSGRIMNGQEDVFNGHRYLNGWDVKPNLLEAVRYYEKAAKVDNVEALYNLGLCYQKGRGVAPDIQKAIAYYRQAANLPANALGKCTRRKKNVFAAAQNCLAVCFENGNGVTQDFQEAAKWYQKAMENGWGSAANSLGNFYSSGKGVPKKDEQMAALCWKEAVNLLDEQAPLPLINYYLEQKEPDLARSLFITAKEMMIERYLRISEEEFEMQCHLILIFRLKEGPEIEEFEKENKLETKGLTFEERRQRMIRIKCGEVGQSINKMPNFMKRLLQSEGRAKWRSKLSDLAYASNLKFIEGIKKRAQEGSKVAQRVILLIEYSIKLTHFFQDRAPFYKGENASDIIQLLYNCVTLPFDELIMVPEDLSKIKEIIRYLFKGRVGAKGEEDKMIRLIYAVINLKGQDDNSALEVLQAGVRRYPDDQFYLFYLAKVYEGIGQHSEAVECFRKGLKYAPNDVHLLFGIANNMWKLNMDCSLEASNGNAEEIMSSFENFLNTAGEDELNVPEAYFQTAHLAVNLAISLGPVKATLMMEGIEETYQVGLAAEMKQLPYFEKKASTKICKVFIEDALRLFSDGTAVGTLESKIDVNKKKKMGKVVKFCSILDRKRYLRAPTRKQLVLQFRGKFEATTLLRGGKPPPLKQVLPRNAAHLRKITLHEMSPNLDKIYYGRVLDLTIIENPVLGHASIHLLAEDGNGDVFLFHVYNVKQDPKVVEETLGFGCKVAVMNPYLRVAKDNTFGIRNDEPGCLIYLGRIEKMCRLCGGKGANFHCAKCKVAKYCCRECQEIDWKEFGHKNICSFIAKGNENEM